MRIPHVCAVLAAAVLALSAGPETAAAQFTVKRSEIAPAVRDDAQAAALQTLAGDMMVLFEAQRAFFREHGRFATELAELPGFPPQAQITMKAGTDWYVAFTGDPLTGVVQHIVFRGDQVPEAAQQAAFINAG